MHGTLKWAQTFGIFAAFGLGVRVLLGRSQPSSVTTVPFRAFAQAMTKGSATGVPFSLLYADEGLKVFDLENCGNELKFGGVGGGKYGLVVLRPLQDFRADRLPLKFVEDLARGNKALPRNEIVQAPPDAPEDTGIEVLKRSDGTGVEDINHAPAPCRTRSSKPAKFFGLMPRKSAACSSVI